MPEIQPFRGLRYAASRLAAEVLAPPFDVIDEEMRARLLRGSPYNVVRIDKGPAGHGAGWYREAAATKQEWLRAGILERDETPALYGYRQVFQVDGEERVRVGFIAAVRLHPWGQGIHPHERTRTGDRADRLMHMRAVSAQMSPVFGLYSDAAGDTETFLRCPEEPLLAGAEIEGVSQSFWRITDVTAMQSLQQFLAQREIVIADGHHRYETALAYQAERRAAEGDPPETRPYDYVMMYLTRAEAPGLTILPTHRLVTGVGALDEEELLHGLHADFEMRPLWNKALWQQGLADAGHGSVALGLVLPNMGAFVLRLRDVRRLAAAAPEAAPELRNLDVTVLQRLILEPLLGISPESLAAGDGVAYTVDAAEAMSAVERGEARAAFLLNPTTVQQVWQAACHGLTMPQKSTYFYPKLLTGLVFRPLDNM